MGQKKKRMSQAFEQYLLNVRDTKERNCHCEKRRKVLRESTPEIEVQSINELVCLD
ncbi:hypothetical protein HDU87_007760 [Geranomyces variabilis]|uniref:Uncharacterized protein n=1 Tax=Geranomyces variabilis TaxID=109894 RepID=A0AAD5TDY8_9FUNG|nr:hypothetical protein HDU87_007760 [Geranomyces variabilis]